jgi:hypothetical protein
MEERIKRGSKRTDRSGEIAMNIRLQTNAKETRADETRSDETRRVETSRNTKHEISRYGTMGWKLEDVPSKPPSTSASASKPAVSKRGSEKREIEASQPPTRNPPASTPNTASDGLA